MAIRVVVIEERKVSMRCAVDVMNVKALVSLSARLLRGWVTEGRSDEGKRTTANGR